MSSNFWALELTYGGLSGKGGAFLTSLDIIPRNLHVRIFVLCLVSYGIVLVAI